MITLVVNIIIIIITIIIIIVIIIIVSCYHYCKVVVLDCHNIQGPDLTSQVSLLCGAPSTS